MINDNLKHQEDLITFALVSTDNYLGVAQQIRESKIATQPMIYDFIYHLANAYDSLKLLGVADKHESYINDIINEVMSYKHYGVSETFSEFSQRIDDELNEVEVDDMVNDLQWEDIYDLYDDDELIYDPSPDDIEEKITPQNRIKKSLSMKRRNPQLSIARNLKLKRTSSIAVLKKRAVNAARRAVYKKLLMGRDRSTLSASEKDMIEKRMKNFKYMQATIAIKMLPKLKAIEQSRLAHRTKKR